MIVFCEKCLISFIGKIYNPDLCPMCRLKRGIKEIIDLGYMNSLAIKEKLKKLLEEDNI
jgi:hypothetical protein